MLFRSKDLQQWQFEAGKFPVAEYVAAHMVNLPTDPAMNTGDVDKVIGFLKANAELLLR